MLVSAKQTHVVQPPQRTDMDPTTAAASALYSGLIQNVQNNAATPTAQASDTGKISDNVNEAFAKTRINLQATDASTAPASSDSTAMSDFKDYMSKTPEQRLRDSLLKEMGLTEEEVKAMPPEQQKAIGEELAQRMEDKLKLAKTENADSSADKDNGQVVDKFLAAL
ncbi:hypothetical protein H7698_29255 [Pseudomonas sp. p50]|uniref:hypothetical protein n=1 Tax=Pseudomonas sp. p50(2008) TaxID=2816832 RepID=UPI00188B072A|nr:hypothetical protein [Pseudomonas sp. p50(2008)]MBF4560159.1 hypothetical protein [Pseudomonas sp. p50(2008)]